MANKNIPEIYSQRMERLCYLSRATQVGYRQSFNNLWSASFSLPADNSDNAYCQPFNLVRIYDGKEQAGLFRIIKSKLKRGKNAVITYECEHVIATLLHDVLLMYHEIGNLGVYTTEVIQYILSRQDVKNWVLGRCDFKHQFLYKWENENLCNALFSVPQPFAEPYHWEYDTSVYPWVVSLLASDTEINSEIRYRKNLQGITKSMDATNLVTEIFPHGSGEGINQTNIKSVNNGSPSLKADTISTYGSKKLIWTDRRFEDPNSLKETALAMLNELKVPYLSYEVSAADLYGVTSDEYDKFREGKFIRVIDTEDGININARVIDVNKPDVTKPGINITLANKNKNVASSIASLQSRMRINETYAQGTNSLMVISFNDNADVDAPATLEFYIPDDMVHLNKALLRITIQNFRGYSKAVGGGGAVATTTENGGGSSQTSSSGGGVSTTTEEGGGSERTSSSGGGGSETSSEGGSSTQTSSSGGSSTQTSSSGGGVTSGKTLSDSAYNVWAFDSPPTTGVITIGGKLQSNYGIIQHDHPHSHTFSISAHTHTINIPNHTHTIDIPNHTHTIDLPEHTHLVEIPNHSHKITLEPHQHAFAIPAHSHELRLPEHTHAIEFGIYTGTKAAQLSVTVDGNAMGVIADYGNVDIVNFLSTDGGGKIKRNAWHNVKITPDKLTRISAYLFLNIGTNSKGGGDY